MVTLDWTAYPHILERLILLADHDSLVALRTVSRALKRESDKRLAIGLILTTEGGRIVVKNRHGRIPAFAQWAFTVPRKIQGLSVAAHLQDVAHSDLSLTPTIDVSGLIRHNVLELLLDNPSRPSVVHVLNRGSAGYALPTDTVIQFTRLGDLSLQRPTHGLPLHLDTPCGIESVYIFHQAPIARIYVRRPRGCKVIDSRTLLNHLVLHIALDMYFQGNGNADRTVVGIQALEGATIGNGAAVVSASESNFRGLCSTLLCDAIDRGRINSRLRPEPSQLAALFNKIKFMSLEEYREKVGPERAAVETVAEGDWADNCGQLQQWW